MEESKGLSYESNISCTNEIKFDVLKIDNIIKRENIYEEGDNKFQFYLDYNMENRKEKEEIIDFPKYITKIKINGMEYIGILSKNFKKEIFGYNIFDNNDEYFGEWNEDKKDGFGIYYFNDDEKENSPIKQLYLGEFKNNVKSGEGIYFRIKKFDEEKKDDISIPIDFNLAIGNFYNDSFTKGIIISVNNGKIKVYKEKIKEGKKNDDNAEVYEDDNKIFVGIIKENIMIEGRIIIMKEGEKEVGYYFSKKENNLEGNINFDYNKGERNDEKFIKKLKHLNNNLNIESFLEIYEKVIKIRESCKDSDNFDYIKNLNFDDVKQELKEHYRKYLYL